MGKGLEALEDLSKLVFIYGGVEQYQVIEKSLKSLEIMKEKRCDIYLLMECERLEHYNENDYLSSDQVLTQEEFDLLKEVLQ